MENQNELLPNLYRTGKLVVQFYICKLYDLLVPVAQSKNLNMRETKTGGVIIPEITNVYIKTAAEGKKLITTAMTNRIMAATAYQISSSRSHCIITIELQKDTLKSSQL